MAYPGRNLMGRLVQPLRDVSASALDGPFRALRHADFQRFLGGQGISLVGTWMQSIALGWLVLDLTHSAFAVGLTTTLGTLPILALTLYGGVVADRVDRRRFIMLLQSVMLAEAAALAYLTLSHRVTIAWIYGLTVLFGTATAFEVPARQSFLVELVPPADLISAAAINSTTYNLARVIGPAIAGVVVATAGAGAAFAVNAVSYIAVLIGLARIEKRHVPRMFAERQSIFTGVRFIRSRPVLAALSWEMVLLTVFSGSFIPMMPVYAREAVHVGARGFGALTSAIGVGASIGAIVVGALGNSISRARGAAVCGAILAGGVVLLGLTSSPSLALVVLAALGAAMAGQGIVTATALQLAAPSELRGRVMAVYSFVVLGLAPIGAFQAGWLAEHVGVGWSIGINGCIGLIGTAVLRNRLWNGKEEPC